MICGAIVLGLPVTFVGTIVLLPLWSWIESRSGIESVGHSGPADWCFLAVAAAWLAVAVTAIVAIERKRDEVA